VREIETQRLRLRQLVPDDLDSYYRSIYADAEVMRFMPGGQPQPRETAARFLERSLRHWDEQGFGPWGVMLKQDGGLIGHCGLFYVEEVREVEVMYALAQEHWGKGLATEGAKASLRFGFEQLGLPRIVAFVMPENTASVRVIEKLGMRFQENIQLWGLNLVAYFLERSAYQVDPSPYQVFP
jgi:ribosomal-protein-alanine N-acetyltransferase